MKDIKDLKENECIHIRNKKEAFKLQKVLISNGIHHWQHQSNLIPKKFTNGGHISVFNGEFNYMLTGQEDGKTIIPASKFLKPSKKELLKRIDALDVKIDLLSAAIKSIDKPFHLPNVELEFPLQKKEHNLEVDFEKVEAKSELEVGKWYIINPAKENQHHKEAIIFYNGYDNFGYGFDHFGKWTDFYAGGNNWMGKKERARLASETEVKEALIAEAEKRGFKKGCKILNTEPEKELELQTDIDLLIYREDVNDLVGRSDTNLYCRIFLNGKWAKIIEQPKEEIDFSQVGLIVEDGDLIVLTNGHYTEGAFGGMVISNTEYYKQGYIASNWAKKCFKPRKEPITISNEII